MQPTAPASLGADLMLVALTAAIAGTIAWIARAVPEGTVVPRWRRGSLWAGVALLMLAFASPLQALAASYLLTAHLIQVTIVMGFAPPLLLLGLPDRTRRHLPSWACRLGRAVTQPVLATVGANALFFAWHATGPYGAALDSPLVYALMQASLLLASLAFWWPIVGPRASARVRLSTYQKLGYILLATIPQTFAGMTVALARHPLYSGYQHAPRVLGLEALTDQQIAGACMALVSKLALFAAFSVVFVRLLAEAPAEDDGDWDHGPGPQPQSPDPEPSTEAAPAWLEMVEAGRCVPEPTPNREATPASR